VSETEQLPSVCEDGEEGRGEEEEKRTGQADRGRRGTVRRAGAAGEQGWL
jgi:hypothetical protein